MLNRQSGMTLIETLVVAMIVAIVVSVSGLNFLDWLRAERQRGAVFELFAQMSRARVEAVNRNRPCRFVVDTGTRTIRVIDLNVLGNNADDQVIYSVTLNPTVGFSRPDSSPAVTLDVLSGSEYEALFDQDGTLTSGAGAVGLWTGDRFHRVSVYAGGGIEVERWNGSSWVTGV